MGGRGSGSWFRGCSKTTTESQHRVDIRWLKKQGYLQAGRFGSLSWACRGKQTGFINYRMEEDRIVLIYRHRINGGEWEDVEQHISFDKTPCNYGGYRTWFLCPRCLNRVAILYGAGKYFLCRHCYDLTYSSQQEAWEDRMLRKSRNIKERLGVKDPIGRIIFKPKGMHQKTFDRLRFQAERCEYIGWINVGRKLGIKV